MQYFWLTVIVAGLLFMSGWFAWRQVQTLQWLRTQEQLPPEDRSYYRRRAFRRMLGCVLTMVLAVLLGGLYFLDILDGLDRLVAKAEQSRLRTLSDEDKALLRFSQGYAGSISGIHGFDILEGVDQMIAEEAKARATGLRIPEEDRAFMRFCRNYVGTVALVVLVLLGVAFVDVLATRRYGMRHRKRLRDDRDAMLQRQLALLRRERNGEA